MNEARPAGSQSELASKQAESAVFGAQPLAHDGLGKSEQAPSAIAHAQRFPAFDERVLCGTPALYTGAGRARMRRVDPERRNGAKTRPR